MFLPLLLVDPAPLCLGANGLGLATLFRLLLFAQPLGFRFLVWAHFGLLCLLLLLLLVHHLSVVNGGIPRHVIYSDNVQNIDLLPRQNVRRTDAKSDAARFQGPNS